MGKYLKLFKTNAEYQQYENEGILTPNVSLVEETHTVSYHSNASLIANLCDVAYWDGSKINVISLDKWSTDFGTPVGVVVIPSGFAPDGKARMIALNAIDSAGNASLTYSRTVWNTEFVDTILPNYTHVPTIVNSNDATLNKAENAFLPSDKFNIDASLTDSLVRYNGEIPYIPSQYIFDGKTLEINPDYLCEILIEGENVNALSDLDGLGNTQTLTSLGSGYVAANAAWAYKDGVSDLQWYLPAIGELGFLLARINQINNVITALGGVPVANSGFWSSTESSESTAWKMATNYGKVYGNNTKSSNSYICAFALI